MGQHEFSREERIRRARLHRKHMNKIHRRRAQKQKCRENLILKQIEAKERGVGVFWTQEQIRLRERAKKVLRSGPHNQDKVLPRFYLKELIEQGGCG